MKGLISVIKKEKERADLKRIQLMKEIPISITQAEYYKTAIRYCEGISDAYSQILNLMETRNG